MSGPMVDMGLLQELRQLQKRVADLEQQRPPLYQRGTWTPKIEGATTAGTTTYTTQLGIWTRIGRVVTCEGNVQWTAVTGTGFLKINGLPVTVGSAAAYNTPAALVWSGLGTAGQPVFAYAVPGQSYLLVSTMPAGGTAAQVTLPASGLIYLQLTYHL